MKTRTTQRTTEITIERRRSVVTRRTTKRKLSYCPICARESEFVTPEAAAALASVTARTIYRWLENGKLHFMETPGGELFICSESLA
jgi:excisionase family DNA binding protein